MRKKILTLAMAAMLLLGLGTTASAETFTVTSSLSTIDAGVTNVANITKLYTATNASTTSPADTFTFEVTKVSFDGATDQTALNSMPAVSVSDLPVASGNATTGDGTSNTLSINLPAFSSVGVYTYKITENASTQAGVVTDSTEYYLVVTVTNGSSNSGLVIEGVALHSGSVTGTKGTAIKNTYNAGTLSISKSVTGRLGDKSEYFAVTVTLTGETGKTYETLSVTGGSYTGNPSTITVGTPATFYLKDDETITIANLPYGVTYTVVEADYVSSEGYKAASYSVNSGTDQSEVETESMDTASETVKITNEKTGTVDTGVILDSLPYILILAVVLLGVVYLVFRKRTSDRY